ncbi:glycosyltransferase family 4 protein [Ginsengibacter hankyongi]|uniref:Glycosyltransferase family 4 protein n=1 Tax=Ginsengibacter hankyongi TaxID=2607284 RepID=A0A5J5IDL1_9BACT|nr:glycosyltransferase family 4 protein [Ginsengibacter hankyongi]KAA9036370.1 glycosyltransferase family 4 protein [Ginsengibacter hankyongi]
MKILFLAEKTFSASGGIEKVCRIAGRTMYEYAIASRGQFNMYARKDPPGINTQPYLPSTVYRGFKSSGLSFISKGVRDGMKSNVVVLCSIRMLLPGYLIKLLSPNTKLLLFTHGIEAWETLSSYKQKMLRQMDNILVVSNYTKERISELLDIPAEKFAVLNHCFDPFLPEFTNSKRRNDFRSSYGLAENDIVLMTISRLSLKEKMKGYEKVMVAIKKLHNTYPHLKYVFVGKYDDDEKKQLDRLVYALGIEYDVTFTGFVPDSVIGDYYNMADAFIVPGEKEGFGISLIEALYYNKPVIAERSNDVTVSPESTSLGIQVDFQSQEEVTNAIQKVIGNIKAFMPDRKLVLEKFSYPVYKNTLGQLLDRCIT